MSNAVWMLVVVLGSPAAVMCPSLRPDAPASEQGGEVARGIAAARRATRGFRKLDQAVEAGYPRQVAQCLSDAAEGGMGYHHMRRDLLDRTLDVGEPEILLYERRADGAYQLNGVEYIVPFSAWPADSIPPRIMGQSLKASASLGLWYLHVWIWRENPSGMFADWNPRVSCLKGDAR